MKSTFNSLMRSPEPGDNDLPSAAPENTDEIKAEDIEINNDEPLAEEEPFIEKVKDALQDWSNKDQQDLDFDDTRV